MMPTTRKLQVITVMQVLCYLVLTIPLRLISWARRDIDPRISQLRHGSLIVANHQWFLDPFIVLAHLPMLSFMSLLPIRFPIKHKFMNNRYGQLLRLVGGYDIGRTPREKMVGLYRARQLLKEGVTIVLFPEGEVNRTNEVGELQRGIDFLIENDTPVMFVRIVGFHRRGVGFLQEPRSVIMTVAQSKKKLTRHEIQKILQVSTAKS